MSTNARERTGHVDVPGRTAAAEAIRARSRRGARAKRLTPPRSIGLLAVIGLAAVLTGAALYGLAAISVRMSMRVIAVTASSDDRDCAARDLIGWGGANCRPWEERQ